MNQLLNQICQIDFAHSSHVERINGTAKNCLGIIRRYLTKNDITIDRKFLMTNFCFTCFKNFIFNFLSDEVYYVNGFG